MWAYTTILFLVLSVYFFFKAKIYTSLFRAELSDHARTKEKLEISQNAEMAWENYFNPKNRFSDAVLDAEIIYKKGDK